MAQEMGLLSDTRHILQHHFADYDSSVFSAYAINDFVSFWYILYAHQPLKGDASYT